MDVTATPLASASDLDSTAGRATLGGHSAAAKDPVPVVRQSSKRAPEGAVLKDAKTKKSKGEEKEAKAARRKLKADEKKLSTTADAVLAAALQMIKARGEAGSTAAAVYVDMVDGFNKVNNTFVTYGRFRKAYRNFVANDPECKCIELGKPGAPYTTRWVTPTNVSRWLGTGKGGIPGSLSDSKLQAKSIAVKEGQV